MIPVKQTSICFVYSIYDMYAHKNCRFGIKSIPYFFVPLLCMPLADPAAGMLDNIDWQKLDEGLFYTEIIGPHVSKISDSKVSILKIDPAFFNFELVTASGADSILRTAKEWCEIKTLSGAVNAGMYSLKDHISCVGLMQTFNHVNNSQVKQGFNALAVFNPKNKSLLPLQIVDMINQDWKKILDNYYSCFQSIRMIDNNGKAVYWKKKPAIKCSMTVLAIDKKGDILFLFSRSPYSANEMINFMLKPVLQIQTAMYLEGGPEATLYVKTTNSEIIKFGSYVSFTKPDDTNVELRKMPNILGIRKKVNVQN